MAKSSRRASRIRAKQRRRAEHERAGNRRRFLRRLTIVGVGVAAFLVAGGLLQEWLPSSSPGRRTWLGSTSADAFESTGGERPAAASPEAQRAHLIARLEAAKKRRQELVEWRRAVDQARPGALERFVVMPALPAGSSAARVNASKEVELVPASKQMRVLAERIQAFKPYADDPLRLLDREGKAAWEQVR